MTAEFRDLIQNTPFAPFSVRMSDGREYSVPTADHVHLSPRGTRVIVVSDDDVVSVLPVLHISAVVHQANGAG